MDFVGVILIIMFDGVMWVVDFVLMRLVMMVYNILDFWMVMVMFCICYIF